MAAPAMHSDLLEQLAVVVEGSLSREEAVARVSDWAGKATPSTHSFTQSQYTTLNTPPVPRASTTDDLSIGVKGSLKRLVRSASMMSRRNPPAAEKTSTEVNDADLCLVDRYLREVNPPKEPKPDVPEGAKISQKVIVWGGYAGRGFTRVVGSLTSAMHWIPEYSVENLTADVVGGITIAFVLIPQAAAYAALSGLPATQGLYSALFGALLYPLFASSPVTANGPTAISAILLSSMLSGAGVEPLTPAAIALCALATLFAGILQCIMGVMNMSWLVNFISKRVMLGFVSAAAVIIFLSQVGSFLGISFESPANTFVGLVNAASALPDTHGVTIVVGLVSLVFLVAVKKFNKKKGTVIPGAAIACLVGITVSYLADFEGSGVGVVGELESGFPAFVFPSLSQDQVAEALTASPLLVILGILETLAAGEKYSSVGRGYTILPRQEFFGMGVANVVTSMFTGFANAGALSRTAVAAQSGVKSQFASVVASFVVLLVVLFLSAPIAFLPKAVLAALILTAVPSLFAVTEAKILWQISRKDFWVMALSAILTLVLGVDVGLLASIGVAILLAVHDTASPLVYEVGRIAGTTIYSRIGTGSGAKGGNAASTPNRVPGVCVVKICESISFSNASYLKVLILGLYATSMDLAREAGTLPKNCTSPFDVETPAAPKRPGFLTRFFGKGSEEEGEEDGLELVETITSPEDLQEAMEKGGVALGCSATATPLHSLVLDMGSVNSVDGAAQMMLFEVTSALAKQGVSIFFAQVGPKVESSLKNHRPLLEALRDAQPPKVQVDSEAEMATTHWRFYATVADAAAHAETHAAAHIAHCASMNSPSAACIV